MAARPGPKPKSTALRIVENDKHKDRYNLNEPVGAPFDPADIPARLTHDPVALEMWAWVAPRLLAMGVLCEIDRVALESLCTTYSMWSLRPSAQMTTKLQSLLCEFGMTPSSRTRLTAAKPAASASSDPVAAKLAAL